jgi:SAM-dependent methyltransferase
MTTRADDLARRSEGSVDAGGHWQIGAAPDGWWSVERTHFVVDRIAERLPTWRSGLDVGCGRGRVAAALARHAGAFVVACDAAPWDEWRNEPRALAHVVCEVTALPFRDGSTDLVLALDVIEHLPDDQPALSELRRVADGHGAVAVTVPALPWLWSAFDDAVGHHRRYRAADLEASCRRAGLAPSDITYFFSWLVLPAWLLRRTDRLEADRPRAGVLGWVVERCTGLLARAERAWLRRRTLPVGTSLWVLSAR